MLGTVELYEYLDKYQIELDPRSDQICHCKWVVFSLFSGSLTFLGGIPARDGRGLYTARTSTWCLQRLWTSWINY